ncbi:hypothetical protein HZB88_01190 [archaeon]|nr:hypothetical protein [archaeon]
MKKPMEGLILECRSRLLNNRPEFWAGNIENFEKNALVVIRKFQADIPSKWKVYVVVSTFLPYRKIRPYDYDSWSATNLIGATRRQGFEIMLFLNRARAEFLSIPALIPLIAHELKHTEQAANNPVRYLGSIMDDALSKEIEEKAERVSKQVPDECRREYVLESILYCYDAWKWAGAKEMADFMYKNHSRMYGGGYNDLMRKDEYKIFLTARKEKDINIFMQSFLIR